MTSNVETYLTIGLLVYFLMSEIVGTRYRKWITWIFVAIILALIALMFWSSWKKRYPEEDTDEPIECEQKGEDLEILLNEPTCKNTFVQEDFHKQRRKFRLTEGVQREDDQITYKDFKEWYLSPGFLQRYTEAVREALKIKYRRLLEVKVQYMKDLKALRAKESTDSLANVLNVLDKSQDVKTIETTISEVTSLLKEIKSKQASLNVDFIRKSLVSALTNRKNGIDSLTGREDVKDFLALQLYTFAQNPRIFFSNFQNMAIYGSSGVGKTKLAQVIAYVYASSGILTRNHVHIITKQSLTTAYVNESARITRKLLLANLDGVIFIDEAYDMTPPPNFLGQGIDHGHEAITEIVNFIDKMIGLSIIIVAGYEKPMEERFMKANEGLPRRFPHKLVLKPYNSKELTSILIHFILETCPELDFDEVHGDFLYTLIDTIYRREPRIFENQAGDMLILSGHISRAVYGSLDKDWETDAEALMLSGINSYLSERNLGLIPLQKDHGAVSVRTS